MDGKVCFKCKRALPLSEFYAHPQMADGHLGKCKGCTKRDVQTNYQARREKYRDYYAKRQRTKERRSWCVEQARKHRARYPEKARARGLVAREVRAGRLVRLACEECGSTERVQAHHPDYTRPLDVQWLCFRHHCAAHGKEAAVSEGT